MSVKSTVSWQEETHFELDPVVNMDYWALNFQ